MLKLIPKEKKGGWIKGAVNPAHKGYCTPMTKSTCTPRRKAFAMTMKKHHGFHKKSDGGEIGDRGNTVAMASNGMRLIPRAQQGLAMGQAKKEMYQSMFDAKQKESLRESLLRTPSETRMRAPGYIPTNEGVTNTPITKTPTLIARPNGIAPMVGRPMQLPNQVVGLQIPQIRNPFAQMDESDIKPYTAWPIAYRGGGENVGEEEKYRGNTVVGTMSVPQVNPKAPWQQVNLTRNNWGAIKGGLNPQLRQTLENKYKFTETLNAPVNTDSETNAKFAIDSRNLGVFAANPEVVFPTNTSAAPPTLISRQNLALRGTK